MKKMTLAVIVSLTLVATVQATDVVNQDNKPYKLKVQSEGKLSISNYQINR